MSRWAAAALLALALAACRPPSVPPVDEPSVAPLPAQASAQAVQAAVAAQPLPVAAQVLAPAVQAPVQAAVEALEALTPTAEPPPPAGAWEAACRAAAAELIVRWEVTSPAYYEKRLRYPVWPGGASGITWGVGYDGGHQTSTVIETDWSTHQEARRLISTAGMTGTRAKSVLGQYRDIPTGYDHARSVFEDRSLVEYTRRTERAFGDGFRALRPGGCAGLVSLVYNRGGAMTGDSRREMREIRDHCVPAADHDCIAREVRAMTRLWRGTVNEKGLTARRESEARLIETP